MLTDMETKIYEGVEFEARFKNQEPIEGKVSKYFYPDRLGLFEFLCATYNNVEFLSEGDYYKITANNVC